MDWMIMADSFQMERFRCPIATALCSSLGTQETGLGEVPLEASCFEVHFEQVLGDSLGLGNDFQTYNIL